ncbi:putative 2-hydroxyacid dehydrogenase [Diaporthe ampelina]|uniref:Putative 2-hydroxyacid dehydrogenase n=1 Tax=Diaporthe ampelina TaxID=1214573 RepID=A0A0G2FDE0_9PEZI|nr:putative 2-hydroxyacid dehydrogenase [Diaporthe ampelina]
MASFVITNNIISINVLPNAGTRHTIWASDTTSMKDGVVIFNTARGAIINEAALADALESGKVAAAGLDVYEREPHINEKLLRQDRALMVAHLGTHTVETLD